MNKVSKKIEEVTQQKPPGQAHMSFTMSALLFAGGAMGYVKVNIFDRFLVFRQNPYQVWLQEYLLEQGML